MAASPASRAPDIGPVASWLVAGALPARLPNEVLQMLCDRLVEAGVNIDRAGVFVTTLHPYIIGRSFVWRRGQQVVIGEADISDEGTPEWRNSPVMEIVTRGQPVRARIDTPTQHEYAVFSELRAEGMTEYFAQPLEFINGERHVASWTTKRKGGFTAGDIAAFEAIQHPLARVAEVYALRRTATNLLNTYVGGNAGARILAGRIRRGHTESIYAAICLADLRGFTALADTLPGESVISLLNAYFDCLVAAIENHGGEVLKFMGDGLLAIFPTSEDVAEGQVCGESIGAAREARVRMAELNQQRAAAGEPTLQFGLALHVGEVAYGNIGGAARLDFTAIGPAVNLAARLEALAGRMGRTIVMSSAVARHCGDGLVSLGRYELRGFRATEEVFGLADESPAIAATGTGGAA